MAQPEADGRNEEADLPPGWIALLDAAAPAFLSDPDRPDEPIVHANPAFLRLAGRPAAEVVGRNVRFLAHERGALPAGHAGPAEFLAATGDGATFWASLTLVPVPGSGLRLGQLADVTRRRDAESALVLSRQREALGLLTNSVAHEFNNFLQILIGYIDGLKRRLGESPEPFIQRAMSRSTDATERAAILTRQLLAFSRKIAPDVRPVDLDALVAGTAERLRPGLPARVRLEVAGTPGLPRAISNPTQVELALGHIVANACEAMPAGGTISLSTFRIAPGDRSVQRPEDGAVGIHVIDTGTGMSPEMLTRALAPFATSREAGRGAGLAIVHGLMKRQNGTIALESSPGAGTQVRLVFPAAPERALH
ncbi:ATP-binding protein [uncultured Methylobacterium sp.]|uniref:ATP-binding protein n=1 Tax=uncultured Methylobacterium sp. TaxID=157278 RepID=UPI0035CC4898